MDYKKIGDFICKIRTEKKMTQKQLADKLYITDRAVSKWERGIGAPDISLLSDLSKILGVSINEILAGKRIENITKDQADKITVSSISLYNKEVRKKSLKQLILITLIFIFILISVFFFNISMIVSNICIEYIIVVFIALFISLILFLKLENNDTIKTNIVLLFCFLYSFSLLIYSFYTGISYYINGIKYYNFCFNLIPLKQIINNINLVIVGAQPLYFLLNNLVIDLCLFMPYSFFIPYLKKENFSLKKYFIVMFLIILAKEFIQLFTGLGIFDINDIILNYTGVIIMYYLMKKTHIN